MALLHQAEIRPTKLELLARWLPGRPWYTGPAAPDLHRVGAYRFDDPAGEVGIEALLVRAGDGPVLHVPLTYRGEPLAGREAWLVGTMDHSVLGPRWAYDACGDPLYAAVLTQIIHSGGCQADEFVADDDGRLQRREPGATVTGSGPWTGGAAPTVDAVARVDDGDPPVVGAGPVELAVIRVLPAADGRADAGGSGGRLTGTWPGGPGPVTLATVASG
jgi:hypothetical protein